MPKIQLTCYSFRSGCVGEPGNVIECSDADAAYFAKVGGGHLVTGSVSEFVPQQAAADGPAPDADSSDEEQETATPAEPVAAGGNPKRARK